MSKHKLTDVISEIAGIPVDSFSIIDQPLDIHVQMEYWEAMGKIDEELDSKELLSQKEQLFDADFAIESKKKLLSKLSMLPEVSAFRAIERYSQNPDSELKDWSLLAVQQSKTLLRNSLLNNNQLIISTGLGGKGTKLRYFVVLIAQKEKPFTELNQHIVTSEFEYILPKYEGELETVEFEDNLAAAKLLIPLSEPVQDIVKEILNKCNELGNFLENNFVVTNIKEMPFDEIREMLNENDFTPLD